MSTIKVYQSKEDKYNISELNWKFYSKDGKILSSKNSEEKKLLYESKDLRDIVRFFNDEFEEISSIKHNMKSDDVLEKIASKLEGHGFIVEKFDEQKREKQQIKIKLDNSDKETKEFRVDAININNGIVIEVEAGRAVANYQFLKDMMECSMISRKKDVFKNGEPIKLDNLYLVIAVRNLYVINNTKNKKKQSKSHDYNKIEKWLDAFAISGLDLNLKGILLIGY